MKKHSVKNLREIIFGDSRSAKSDFLTHLEALNFGFYEFMHILKTEIYHQKTIFRAPKMTKTALSRFSKFNFT